MYNYKVKNKTTAERHRKKRPDYRRDMPVERFLCVDKETGETLQGIEYLSGKVLIGFDAWRILNRMDSCSYEYRVYRNKEEAMQRVSIKKPAPKAYYVPESDRLYKGGYLKNGILCS